MIEAENIVRIRVTYVVTFEKSIALYDKWDTFTIAITFYCSYLSFTFSDDIDNIGGGCNMV